MKYEDFTIDWLGHDSFKIKANHTIYIDPFKIFDKEKADIILITHEHYDHLSIEDIKKIIKPSTIIVTIPLCLSNLNRIEVKDIKLINPGQKINVLGYDIIAVPAYNTNKFRSPGIHFHPKIDERIGYIININGKRIYHAGDTDLIPEMSMIKNVDIALLPVSGTYVMTAEEAAKAAKIIKPKLAIAMHYNSIVGTEEDAKKFKKLAEEYCKVEILS